MWYRDRNGTRRFREPCEGPHCNEGCPEMFILNELTSDSWLPSSKVAMVLIVVGVALFCITMKVVFVVWLWRLEWKQQLHLGLLGDESYTTDIETALQVRVQGCVDTSSLPPFPLSPPFPAPPPSSTPSPHTKLNEQGAQEAQ